MLGHDFVWKVVSLDKQEVSKRISAETTTFHWFLFVSLFGNSQTTQPIFRERIRKWWREKAVGVGERQVGERTPRWKWKPRQEPDLARASSAPAPAARGCQQDRRGAEALQGRCRVEKGEGRWGQGGTSGWSGSREGGHIQECNFI